MTWFSGLMVYAIVWWLALLMVLPFGNHAPEAGEVEPGHADSAPMRPRIVLKAVIATGIATVIWGGIFWMMETNVFSFRAP
jgi:predicted secreted protein